MTTPRDQYFSFMTSVVKELQKTAPSEAQRYLAFIDNLIMAAQELSDEEIDGIVSGELEYRLVDRS